MKKKRLEIQPLLFMRECIMKTKVSTQSMLVAGTTHAAMATVSAAGGFACFLILYHAFDDGNYKQNQNEADDDGCDVFRNPCQHMKDSFLIAFPLFYLSCKLGSFLVRSYKLVNHSSQKNDSYD